MGKTIAILFAVTLLTGCATKESVPVSMPEKSLFSAPAHPDKINPSDYDKWFGKKPRIYLQGMWKIKKLDGTLGKPENAIGENAGFAKSVFNDSKWALQAVPGNWNSNRKKDFFGGTTWYRTKFKIPESYKGERILLHFGRITFESTIFVNGEKVGSHSNIMRAAYSIDSRSGADDFTLDITPMIDFGAENTVAVKVYMDKAVDKNGNRGPSAGIVWPAWLEIAAPIYQQKALIKPDLKNSTIKVSATIVNTFKEKREVVLSAQASTWKSKRYQAPGPDNSTETEVWQGVLEPGVNQINFKMKLDDPVKWTLQKPYLYNLKIFANGDLIGQERFGFREFSTSGSNFLLNGKKVYFTGALTNNVQLMCTGAQNHILWKYCNRNGHMERMLKAFRNANLNMLRPHSTHMEPVYYDLADELGLMVNEEMYPKPLFTKNGYTWIFKNAKLAPGYVKYLKHRMDVIHNHPSVVIFSIGNEMYDNVTYAAIGSPEGRSWAPFINAVYDVVKAHYPEMLFSSSGRTPTKGFMGSNSQEAPAVKCDYGDIHNYTGSMRYPWTCLPREMEYYFKEYTKEQMKPVINGEFMLGIYNEYHGRRERKKMLDKNGKLSKEKYLELLEKKPFKYPHKLAWDGYRILLSDESNYLRDSNHFKEVLEVYRRNKQFCTGFEILHVALFKRYQKNKFEPTPLAKTLKQVCNPTFVCLDIFDKNVFAGKELKFKIYLFNELPEELENVTVKVELKGIGLEYSQEINAGDLANGEKKIIPFNYETPSKTPTGDCTVKLTMYVDKKEVSNNEYKFFVLGKDKTSESIPSNKKIALFTSNNPKELKSAAETSKILNSLGIKYSQIQNMKDLNKFDIIIVAQNSMPAIKALNIEEKLAKWLKNGGLALCFEQNKSTEIPFLPGVINIPTRKTVLADVFDTKHPIFNDLNHWNFRCWNGDNGTVSSSNIIPLNMGVLAASSGTPHKDKWGMALSEIGVGKGRVLISDLLATERYMRDSVATKYIQNLLAYCLGDKLTENIYQFEIKKKKDELDLKVNRKKVIFADLKAIADMGFVDEKAGDKKGGWTDQGPNSDLSEFKPGIKTLLGVPFKIIDPAKNNGKSCVVLRPAKGGPSKAYAFLPEKASFPINKTDVKRIFFLVASAWSKGTIGEFVINWEGASSPTATVPLEIGVNLRDWGSKAETLLAGGHTAWTSLTGRRIYLIEWKNPELYSNIRSIEFKSTGSSIPILLGVTLEIK